MMISIILIFIMFLLFLIYNHRNAYAIIFSGICFSIDILIFLLIIYISRLSVYNSAFWPENYIADLLNYCNIRFFQLKTITALTMAVLMSLMWCLALVEKNRGVKNKKNIKWLIGLIPAIMYAVLNSYQFALYMHINMNGSGYLPQLLGFIGRHLSSYNNICIYAYIMCPLAVLIYNCCRTKIKYIRIQKLVIAACVFLIDIFILLFLVNGSFSNIILTKTGMYEIAEMLPKVGNKFYFIMPMIIFLLFNIMCYLMLNFRILTGVDFFKRAFIIKNCKLLSTDIRHIFHSQKNMLFSVELMGKRILKSESREETEQTARKLIGEVNEIIEKCNRFLALFNSGESRVEIIELMDVIAEAANKCGMPENIKLVIQKQEKPVRIFGDAEQLKEIFCNIINNSRESIEQSARRNEGRILISADSEDGWVYIRIHDNGQGIPKKILKRVFDPLFTTKSNIRNWGMGLSYAKKLICAHNGMINIESIQDKFCEVQILLPIYQGEKR
ncbi:MAG: sensor histidine kinase [Monoglobaceae bacterium]